MPYNFAFSQGLFKAVTRMKTPLDEILSELRQYFNIFYVVISCTFISAERFNTEKSPLLLNVRREVMVV